MNPDTLFKITIYFNSVAGERKTTFYLIEDCNDIGQVIVRAYAEYCHQYSCDPFWNKIEIEIPEGDFISKGK